MADLLVVLIILGCAAYQYLKGTLVKSVVVIITAICASIVAFGYFELLANVFISRSDNSHFSSLVPWAQSLSFVLLFVLTFAILQTITAQLTRRPVDLGLIAERIGRIICGIFLGLILSGLLLTALALAPLPNNYPYQRFDANRPNAEKPDKVLFNADGFVTGWFSIVSSGSFSGTKSFATLHPAFLDQLFLNRHNIADDIPIVTSSQAIIVPRKKAAWPAPEGLKDAEDPNKPVEPNLLIAVLAGLVPESAVADPNLVSWWKFDEGGGTTAYDSAGDNHGTLINNPTWTTGQIGGALSFDGLDDKVVIPYAPSLDIADAITIQAWVKWNGFGGRPSIINKRTLDNSPAYYKFVISDEIAEGRLRWSFATAGVNRNIDYYWNPSIGDWYFISVTYDSAATIAKIYVDGIEVKSQTVSGAMSTGGNAPTLIGRSEVDARSFNGLIDEVRIYKQALSAEEIQLKMWGLERL